VVRQKAKAASLGRRFHTQLPGQKLDNFFYGAGFKINVSTKAAAGIRWKHLLTMTTRLDVCCMVSNAKRATMGCAVERDGRGASLTQGMQVSQVCMDAVTGERKVRPSFYFYSAPLKGRQDTGLSTEVPFKIMKWLLIRRIFSIHKRTESSLQVHQRRSRPLFYYMRLVKSQGYNTLDTTKRQVV
jgi:hypothetical protein